MLQEGGRQCPLDASNAASSYNFLVGHHTDLMKLICMDMICGI